MTWTPPKVVAAVFAAVLVVDSVSAVWGERRPVGGFFEEFVARFIFWGGTIAVFAGAIFGGIRIFEMTNSKFFGWIAGLTICVFLVFATRFIADLLPGVDWRYQRLIHDRDY